MSRGCEVKKNMVRDRNRNTVVLKVSVRVCVNRLTVISMRCGKIGDGLTRCGERLARLKKVHTRLID